MKASLSRLGSLVFFLGVFFFLPIDTAQSATPPRLSIQTTASNQITLSWTNTATGYVLDATDGITAPPLWQPITAKPQLDAIQFSLQFDLGGPSRFFRLRNGVVLTTIVETSPSAGESGVSVTRETVLRFSEPLAPDAVLSGTSFYALFGGRRILTRPELSLDRKTATLFYLENLPGSGQVQVTFDGDAVANAAGQAVDADGDGQPGGVETLTFQTASLSGLPNTAVIGHVFASVTNSDGSNHPLAGVTVTVDGAEETLRVVTDATGSFMLTPAPSGSFFVHIDGRTSGESHWPNGAYYPFVGKQWEAKAGYSNNLAGGTGTIYLPLVAVGSLQTVSPTAMTVITFPASVLAANPALAGVQLEVPANALFSASGVRGGRVGIAPVPPDRLPGPLPPGLHPPLVITIQTDGAQNFDQPVPIKFPNLPDPITGIKLPAGAKSALWSFNHDTGHWEIQGPATVTADGNFIVSDPGVGVRQPGWHLPFPGSGGGGPTGPDCPYGCGPDTYPKPKPKHHCDATDPCAHARTQFLWALDGSHANGGSGNYCDACAQYDPEGIGYLELFRLDHDVANGGTGNTSPNTKKMGEIVDMLYQDYLQCRSTNPDPCADTTGNSWIPTPRSPRQQTDLDPDFLARIGQAIQLTATEQDATTPYVPMPSPGDWFMIESLDSGFVQRGRLNSQGRFDPLVLAPNEHYAVRYYDPVHQRRGVGFFLSSASGLTTIIPSVLPVDEAGVSLKDSDGDGLPDLVERIVGTNPHLADSDGDGIPDGVEVAVDSDPLDGRPAATGTVASLASSSPLGDLAGTGDFLLAAAGNAGAIFYDVHDPLHPMVLGQVPSPDGGGVVAVAADDSAAAMLSDQQFVSLLDLGNGANAKVINTVFVPDAKTLAAGSGRIYVGTKNLAAGSMISVLDARTGQVLSTLAVDGSAQLLFRDHLLYVAGFNPTLKIYDAHPDMLGLLGQVDTAASFGGQKWFVAQGYAYEGSDEGIYTVDVRNPSQPTLLGQPTTIPRIAAHNLAVNGSGLLASVQGSGMSLYNIQNLLATTNYLGTLPTPSPPAALVFQRGFAVLATFKGLVTVNYQPADTGTNPPAITLAYEPSIPTGRQDPFDLFATTQTSDDVQVRTVEFYIDGALAATSGTFPFETHLKAPDWSPTKTNFVLRAKATDTGGNVTWTGNQTVPIVLAPPVLLGITSSPRQPLGVGMPFQITARFQKPLTPGSVTPGSCQLISGGTPVPGGGISLTNGGNDVVLSYPNGVAVGQYTFVLGTGITSLSGGAPLPAAVSYAVTVTGFKLWLSDLNGAWALGANWSGGTVPGTNDFVVIDRAGANPVVQVTGEQHLRSLISNENLDFTNSGTLYLEDLAVLNGSVTVEPSASANFTGGSSILHGPLHVSSASLSLYNHVMELAPTATPHYLDGYSITPAGTANLAPSELRTLAGSVLEIHAIDPNNLLVHINNVDQSGGVPLPPSHRSTFRNDGELRKTGPGLASIYSIQFQNNGTVNVQEGLLNFNILGQSLAFNGVCQIASAATLQVWGTPTSTVFGPAASVVGDGVVEVKGATVQSYYRFAGLTHITGTVNFTGPVHAAGPWRFDYGIATFSGLSTELTGPITLGNGSLIFNGPTEAVLSSPISVEPDFGGTWIRGTGRIRITSDLTLTNRLNLGSSDTAQIFVDGAMDIRTNITLAHVTINGPTTWHSGNVTSDSLVVSPTGSIDLVATNAIDIWGGGIFVNQGTISKTNAGTTRLLTGYPQLVNEGLFIAGAGTISLESGAYQQTAGETRLAGGDLMVNNVRNSQFTFSGGHLTGAGLLGGKVLVTGSADVSPGSPMGTLVISNNAGPVTLGFTTTANQPPPQLNIDIAGPAPGTGYDQIVVAGTVNFLDATLNIHLLNGYLPNIGDTFQILRCTSWSNRKFTSITGAAFTAGRAFKVNYVSTGPNPGVVLEVIASP
jgi:hypothetical protein